MAGLTRGPRPKVTKVKELEGDRNKAGLPGDPVQPPKKKRCPRPPEWLGPIAQTEWRRVAPWLFKNGLLTDVDITALAIYCSALEVYILAAEDLAKNGATIHGARGDVRNPATATMKAAADTIRAFCGEFGLTPNSRSRMELPDNPDDDNLDNLLG